MLNDDDRRASAQSGPLRFIAEAPLGKLAKWLRLLGFDTCYAAGGLKDQAVCPDAAQRIRLTKSKSTAAHDAHRLCIRSDRVCTQLVQVIQTLDIQKQDLRLFCRCLLCNRMLQAVDKDDIRGEIPDHVWLTHDRFKTCRGCARIYWPGSHTDRSRSVVERLFD